MSILQEEQVCTHPTLNSIYGIVEMGVYRGQECEDGDVKYKMGCK